MDKDSLRKVRSKEIAMVFQDPMTSLNPVLTVGSQITESLELFMGMDKKQAKERALELLEMVNIPDPVKCFDDYTHQFSGGMNQRAMLAMALSCMPQILIADEPTTALDVTIQAQIVRLVKQLRDELGMAIIWITHDLGVVAGLAENVIVMYAGAIVEMASVKDLYGSPSHPYTIGLLGSLPRVDMKKDERLVSIKGMPPDLIALPEGCPFAARCDFAIDRCLIDAPQLISIAPEHKIACWIDTNTGRER